MSSFIFLSVSPTGVRPSDVLLMAVCVFKTSERTKHTRETTVITIRGITTRDWSILQGYHEPNQKVSKKSNNVPAGELVYFSQVACLLVSCICYNTRGVDPVTVGVFVMAQTSLCSVTKQSKTILLSKTTLARKSSYFCWEAIGLAADSGIMKRVKENCLLMH